MAHAAKIRRAALRSPGQHWVGDGFPVQTLFSYRELGELASPFLLLDHAGPAEFGPTTARRGVGAHPHRGFETVTIVHAGEVAHRDSAGGGGLIGPGDVQWMTAGSGLLHEEFHGPGYARRGGRFEMVQLWVNLSAAAKRSPPAYQAITAQEIPRVELSGGMGTARIIAGSWADVVGPARTHSPLAVFDLDGPEGLRGAFSFPEGWTTIVVGLEGTLLASGDEVGASEVAVFSPEGSEISLVSDRPARALILAGKPLDEPIVGAGPFVMNTAEELHQAMADYRSGRFGTLR